jgi:NSS family neurotransmitter:Na+ symporter
MKAKRGLWATRLGFYLVAIGSACGLGNIWRFPYVAAENGGGAFVLLYLVLALVVGLPLLIGELLMGKHTQRSLMGAGQQLSASRVGWIQVIGSVSIILALLILSYYAVISGWVLHFVMQFLSGFVRSNLGQKDFLSALMNNGLLQSSLASVHLVLVFIVVIKGVQEGVEKWIGNMMPLFIVLLMYLVWRSLSLSSSEQALRFLFYPNFSKLNADSLISALGHVFFTLSVGFGSMVTFGSYMQEDDHVPTAGFRVAMTDSLISLLAGLLIFPMALQASNARLTDPTLIFEALPGYFMSSSRAGPLIGLVFFLCLYIASLGASIGLLEVVVSNLEDRFPQLDRRKAAIGTSLIAFLIATIPAFSSSNLSQVRIAGKGLLESIDIILITWVLPLVALGSSVVLSSFLPQEARRKEFDHTAHLNSASLYWAWKWALRYFIPAVIVLGFALRLFA